MNSIKGRNIIHFTKSFQVLEKILLDGGLRLKYCQEEFFCGKGVISAAVHPMVSFSAYDDYELKKVRSTYGRYAIAFDRDWAIRNGLHEVLYLEKNSVPANALASLLKARQGTGGDFPRNLRLPVMQIKCFIKNSSGKIRRSNMTQFDFRSENEWRYVPTKAQIDGKMISQNRSYYKEHKKELNAKIFKYMLRFLIGDVVRIYVDKPEEIEQLADRTGLDRNLISVSNWTYEPLKKI